MTSFSQYKISGFRNLSVVDVEPSPHCNVIVGENGSGKSSFLEGLSVLSHGKSFRTHRFRSMIKEGDTEFVLFARMDLDDGRADIPLGIERSRGGGFSIKLDGSKLNTSSDLASKIPLIIIDSSSFSLIEGGPKERRQFFDWLVFHVKHDFGNEWRQVLRCFKQRNSLLRKEELNYGDLEPWDIEICRAADNIQEMRAHLFDAFIEEFQDVVSELGMYGQFLRAVSFTFKSGWKEDGSFRSQLRDNFDRDRRYGYSTIGPHKADILLKSGGSTISEVFSRGQTKLLISAMYICKARLLRRLREKRAVIAIDDLPSELDGDNQKILGQWLSQLGQQVFISAIEEGLLSNVTGEFKDSELRVFHVKHGVVT